MKKLVLLFTITIFALVGVGCQKDVKEVQVARDTISQEDYEKLPDDQQDSELDKALAKARKEKKEGTNGDGTTGRMPSGIDLPGYIEDPNNFSTEVLEDIFETIFEYLERKGIETTGNATIGSCYDPRMNNIYKDKDKGVARGYKNKDIFVAEYETKNPGIYSYLIVVREKNGKWHVLYDGTSYKE